jgi:hypothetical protein
MKPYERYIRFVKNVSTTLSDEQMTKIKGVDLQKLYNFIDEQLYVTTTLLGEQMTKIKCTSDF